MESPTSTAPRNSIFSPNIVVQHLLRQGKSSIVVRHGKSNIVVRHGKSNIDSVTESPTSASRKFQHLLCHGKSNIYCVTESPTFSVTERPASTASRKVLYLLSRKFQHLLRHEKSNIYCVTESPTTTVTLPKVQHLLYRGRKSSVHCVTELRHVVIFYILYFFNSDLK